MEENKKSVVYDQTRLADYTEDSTIYQYLADQERYAKYIVECFLLMSGYFLYQSIQKHPGQSTG